MDRTQTKRFTEWLLRNRAAIEAFANGKQIQVKYGPEAIVPTGHDKEWNDADEIHPFSYYNREYRIKPAPKKIYAVMRPDGWFFHAYELKASAASTAKNLDRSWKGHTVVTFEEKET